jgi:SAM-dependent methyltransferase
MVRTLHRDPSDRPLHVLEAGAGIGTMIERLFDRGALSRADYLAIDRDPDNLETAAARLEAWATRRGLQWQSVRHDDWRLADGGVDLRIRWRAASLFDLPALPGNQDLVLAHAFLDLVDLEQALPRLLGSLRPGGVFYFSLNFDGLTAFLPALDKDLDDAILRAYHATMDRKGPEGSAGGGSRTGRRLLTQLPQYGGRVLDAGSSDWIVFPTDRGYSADEEIFLQTMIRFVEEALRQDAAIDSRHLDTWLERRRAQFDAHQLAFLAHQIDVVGQSGG